MDELLTFLFKRMGDPTEVHYENLLLQAGNGHLFQTQTLISPRPPNLIYRHPMSGGASCHCNGSPICRPVPIVKGLPSTHTSASKLISPTFYMGYSSASMDYSSVQPQALQSTSTILHKDIVFGHVPDYCQNKPDLLSLKEINFFPAKENTFLWNQLRACCMKLLPLVLFRRFK